MVEKGYLVGTKNDNVIEVKDMEKAKDYMDEDDYYIVFYEIPTENQIKDAKIQARKEKSRKMLVKEFMNLSDDFQQIIIDLFRSKMNNTILNPVLKEDICVILYHGLAAIDELEIQTYRTTEEMETIKEKLFDKMYNILVNLIDVTAGEQEDEIELAKVYGKMGAFTIQNARSVVNEVKHYNKSIQ